MTITRLTLIDRYDLSEDRFQGLKKLINDLCAQPESELNLILIKKSLNGEFSILCSFYDNVREKLSRELEKANYDILSRRALSGKYDHNICPAPKEPFEFHEEEKRVESPKISISSMSILNSLYKEEKRKPSLKNILTFKK